MIASKWEVMNANLEFNLAETKMYCGFGIGLISMVCVVCVSVCGVWVFILLLLLNY